LIRKTDPWPKVIIRGRVVTIRVGRQVESFTVLPGAKRYDLWQDLKWRMITMGIRADHPELLRYQEQILGDEIE
jgi:hypothetical protein